MTVTVSFPESQKFLLGGIEIEPGADCGIFSLNQKYDPIPVHLDRDDFRIFGKVCSATR